MSRGDAASLAPRPSRHRRLGLPPAHGSPGDESRSTVIDIALTKERLPSSISGSGSIRVRTNDERLPFSSCQSAAGPCSVRLQVCAFRHVIA